MVQLLVEIFPSKALSQYWTHLERNGQDVGVSSTTLDGITPEGKRYVQCIGQFLVVEEVPLQEYSVTFLLERRWKTKNRNYHRRVADLHLVFHLDAQGCLSSVESHSTPNLSVAVSRI